MKRLFILLLTAATFIGLSSCGSRKHEAKPDHSKVDKSYKKFTKENFN